MPADQEDSVVLGRMLLALMTALTISCAGARLAPTSPAGPRIDPKLLRGAWTDGGPSFVLSVGERRILFEFDMKEHPYRLRGDILAIDFEDPTLGVQRKRILRLTADELELQDEASGYSEVLRRMKE